MTYTLFIDDERHPVNVDSVVARSYDKAVEYVKRNGTPKHVDFDHDLGDGKTGLDFAWWLIHRDIDGFGFPETYAVHSQNPIGKENIMKLMNNYMEKKK